MLVHVKCMYMYNNTVCDFLSSPHLIDPSVPFYLCFPQVCKKCLHTTTMNSLNIYEEVWCKMLSLKIVTPLSWFVLPVVLSTHYSVWMHVQEVEPLNDIGCCYENLTYSITHKYGFVVSSIHLRTSCTKTRKLHVHLCMYIHAGLLIMVLIFLDTWHLFKTTFLKAAPWRQI